jgi:hypothetical protein
MWVVEEGGRQFSGYERPEMRSPLFIPTIDTTVQLLLEVNVCVCVVRDSTSKSALNALFGKVTDCTTAGVTPHENKPSRV